MKAPSSALLSSRTPLRVPWGRSEGDRQLHLLGGTLLLDDLPVGVFLDDPAITKLEKVYTPDP